MEDLNDKITGGNLTASEWNQVPSEIQNVIENTGQTLTNSDLNQLGKGIANYSANSTFYTDSGAVNTYVLTAIGLKQSPTTYTDGLLATFRVSATNTGASTVNVATLGVQTIFYKGSPLNGGELTAGLIVSLVYDNANGRFDLVPNLSNFLDNTGVFKITSPTMEKLRLISSTVNGNVSLTFYQTTTKRAYIEYNDTLDDLQLASEYGRVSFWTDNAGTESLAGYVDTDQGLVWGTPTGGSQGAGTGNFENNLYVEGEQLFFPSVSGYLKSFAMFRKADTVNEPTNLDIAALLTEDTYESIGPTGSSADNIWTAMNSMPGNAKFVTIRIKLGHIITSGAVADTRYSAEVRGRKTGDTSTLPDTTILANTQITTNDSALGAGADNPEVTIPIDSSGRFDLIWRHGLGGSIGTINAKIAFVGWYE